MQSGYFNHKHNENKEKKKGISLASNNKPEACHKKLQCR